jgi:hypothetical protein
MESIALVISIVLSSVQLLAMLVAGVWFVLSLKTGSKNLESTIDALTHAITDLKKTIEKIEEKQHDHDVRVSLLERSK